jgi:lipopolysaccharide transport system permease protein
MQGLEMLAMLVLKDLRVRYKSRFLGYLWAVANPLAFCLVYYIAFHRIMRVQMEHYPLFLLTGLFPWVWASNAISLSAMAYRANPGLVRKVRMRRAILPLSGAVQEMLHFFFAVPILLGAVILALGVGHATWVVLIPLLALVQLAMIYPIGLAVAAVNVVVRDIEYLVGIGLQMLFFLTPIVYPVSAVPAELRPYLWLNPFEPLIAAWRAALVDGRLDLPAVLHCGLFAAAAAVVAWWIHRAIEPRIGELL